MHKSLLHHFCICSYDLALISGALSEIRDHFNLSEALEEAIVGAAKVGAFFGTFLGDAHPSEYCYPQVCNITGMMWTIALHTIL